MDHPALGALEDQDGLCVIGALAVTSCLVSGLLLCPTEEPVYTCEKCTFKSLNCSSPVQQFSPKGVFDTTQAYHESDAVRCITLVTRLLITPFFTVQTVIERTACRLGGCRWHELLLNISS